MKTLIDGVVFKNLVTHNDERGFFREILRADDPFFAQPFGQWSQSYMKQDVLKAWHYHKIQTDYFYVPLGIIRVGLCDMRPYSKTKGQTMDFLLGDDHDPFLVKVPPLIAHGVKSVKGPSIIIYLISHLYYSIY